MLVNSIIFWQFFGFFLLPYFYLKERKMQNTWILVASYVFYGWTDWRMVGLLLLATTLFYGLATSLARVQKRQTAVQSSKFKNQSPFSVDLTKDAKLIADSASSVHTKALMIFGVVFGVGMLAYFKYMIFFIEQIAATLGLFGIHTNWSSFNIIVPIGISFFTFKLISYIVEVCKGNYCCPIKIGIN